MSRFRPDPWLLLAFVAGLILRVTPVYLWGFGALVRDEAQYANLARHIRAGDGLISPQDWLWAPAYPYLIAGAQLLFPGIHPSKTVPYLQCVVGALACVGMYAVAQRVFDRRAARIAAIGYALHPTLIYFSGRLWCEGIYGPVLIAAVWATLWARDGRPVRGVVPGLLIGACVLLRGVATYMPPLFLLAAVWPAPDEDYRAALAARWRHALALGLAVVLSVAPYSLHASSKHGGLIISDATVGNLMYLGNNDFEPITFDYGNGIFKNITRGASTRRGRPHCPSSTPLEWNRCEVARGMAWIQEHPDAFVGRMPMRTAQLVNPNTFLTRALRWGKYAGLPWWMKELLVLSVAGTSFLVMVGGTVGAAARARGPYAWMAIGIVAYTVAASAALYGLSRFRLPLEPLWMIYLAGLLAEPRQAWEVLRTDRLRLGLCLFWTPLLFVHMLWYLPAGWPGFNW